MFAAREPGRSFSTSPSWRCTACTTATPATLLGSAVRSKLDERVRDRVIAETRGNPLALLELPRGLTPTELAGGFGVPGAEGLSGRIRESFVRRLETLTDDARRLVLLAAAEPVGDPLLLWRAADRLGIAPAAAEEAEAQDLLAIGERVRFRHPLARSAIYRSAAAQERRAIHLALAEATDRDVDPDRRAWHLAAAAAGPDEQVASELQRSAGRAQARGGLAAAAAFLQRAVALTEDPARRVERALVAAQANLQAGAFDAALGLLATAEAGPIDESQRARVELLRAEIAFASRRGSAAPALLLRAAKRIEPFDVRDSPAPATSKRCPRRCSQLASRRRAAACGTWRAPCRRPRRPRSADRRRPAPRWLGGIVRRRLRRRHADTASRRWRSSNTPRPPRTSCTCSGSSRSRRPSYGMTRAGTCCRGFHVELARSSGALSELPLALNSRIYVHLFRGELETADALIDEARVAIEATEAGLTPWGAVALAALRGREHDANAMLDVAAADATQRGEGIGVTVIAWARALLYNGLGIPDQSVRCRPGGDRLPDQQRRGRLGRWSS